MKRILLSTLLAATLFPASAHTHGNNPATKLEQATALTPETFRIRDPFVLVDKKKKCYYIITVAQTESRHRALRAYRSTDLEHWYDAGLVYDSSHDALACVDTDKDVWWAPDTYRYKGRYYTFVTSSAEANGIPRFTTALCSDKGPLGPYHAMHDNISQIPLTPDGVQCIDGSLFVDNDGTPWIVYTKEWNGPEVQNKVGEAWAQRLTKKLDGKVGDPIFLFRADEAPWVPGFKGGGHVVDAPFIWRDKQSGRLVMLWSSFTTDDVYAVGQLTSETGTIRGPWKHEPCPVFVNGGHQMLFHDLDGNLKMSLHYDNNDGHLRILDVEIADGILRVTTPSYSSADKSR